MGQKDEAEESAVPSTTTPPEPAELAYSAYCGTRNWKAVNGDPLPLWVDVKEDIKEGWRVAVKAVLPAKEPVVDKGETLRLASEPADVELPILTDEEINTMDLEEACSQMSNRVYKVCLLYEQLEHRGVVRGNGHHAAQHIAKLAEDELRERWITKPVTASTTKT
jgi:hypothetical protein